MPKLAEAARIARRDQIIAAGAACFARSGYHATTMADIAAAAGVSKGTPYLYFPSKEGLFIALHEEWDCGLATRVGTAVAAVTGAADSSPRRILRAVAAAIAAHVTEHPQTCRVLMESVTLAAFEPAIAANVRAAQARNLGQLENLFAAGIAAGEWPPGTDPALRARLFTAGLHGLMAQWHTEPGSFSFTAAAAALVDAESHD
jgi:AcrR family transcriptional regulator